MTAQKMHEALAGKDKEDWALAVVALIDAAIEEARLKAETAGLGTIERSEACGAASYMRGLKKEFLVRAGPVTPENPVP